MQPKEPVFVVGGSATVGPEGESAVELRPGDLASFPPGQTFIWTVLQAPLKMMRGIRTQSGKIEIISVNSKTDDLGHRVDLVEFAYQWKFDEALARQLGRKKFQLHCKAWGRSCAPKSFDRRNGDLSGRDVELLSPSLQLPSPTVCGAPVRGARRAHQALVTVARNKQFLLQIASEEKRWEYRGDDYQVAIDTFKLTY
eukprot:g10873.t1